jgi:hypothetical protein
MTNMSVVKTLNHLNKEKMDLIYNLKPDEFTKLINRLFINMFDSNLNQIDITSNKVLNENFEINKDFKIKKQKVIGLNDFIMDILNNMPDTLADKTKVTYKVNLNEFIEHQVNKLGDLLKIPPDTMKADILNKIMQDDHEPTNLHINQQQLIDDLNNINARKEKLERLKRIEEKHL